MQESIIGSRFIGTYEWENKIECRITPTITGRAFITGEAKLLLDEQDPFCWGIT